MKYKLFLKFITYHLFLMIAVFGCKKGLPQIVENEAVAVDEVAVSVPEITDTVLTSFPTDSSSKSEFYYNTTGNFKNIQKGWQGCPNIGYENGHLFIGYYIGAKGEEPGNYISVAISNDFGMTWKKDALIVAYNNSNGRVFDPAFWTEKGGILHLSWSVSSSMWDGAAGGVWTSKIREDKNGNVVLSKPRRFFDGVMNVRPTHLKVDSSKLVFPVSGWNIPGNTLTNYPATPTPFERNGAFLYISSYDSKTKYLNTPQLLCKLPTTFARTFDEHMVVEVEEDNYICVLRSDAGISSMRSSDAGKTWSAQTMLTDIGPTTSSRFYFSKLKSGNLIFVLNNSTIRDKMTVLMSRDKGRTWPYKLLIDSRNGSSYPDVVQMPNGEICLTYDWGRGYPNGYIYFAKFSEADIVSGDPTKVYKTVVTKLIQ